MKILSTIVVVLAATSLEAKNTRRADVCPAVWTEISSDLTKLFVQADGQCNDASRQAIRAVFHDCATWATAQGDTGGCDGSLILSAEENARPENRGLQNISTKIKDMAQQRGVGVADLLMFAGAHATLSCPLGPTVKTMIGRKDSATAAPNESLLPGNANMSSQTIISLFADKGFSAADVSALVGAHSSAKQFITDPARAGEAIDRTPGIWDVDFYNDTANRPEGVFVFDSDLALMNDPRSGPAFKSFVGQQAKWNQAFADTFARLMLLGVPSDAALIDCTSALPPPTDSFPGANEPEPAPGPGGDDSPPGAGGPGRPTGGTGPHPTKSNGGKPNVPSRTFSNRPNNFPSCRPTGGFGGQATWPTTRPSGFPTNRPNGGAGDNQGGRPNGAPSQWPTDRNGAPQSWPTGFPSGKP